MDISIFFGNQHNMSQVLLIELLLNPKYFFSCWKYAFS